MENSVNTEVGVEGAGCEPVVPTDLPSICESFDEARRASFVAAMEYKQGGGKLAGYLCSYSPLELLDAAGVAAVGLCGMNNETIPDAETVLPKNLCPLIKGTYGFALTNKCPFTYFSDMVLGETTCDGKKKAYEILGADKKTYVMDIPQMKREKDIQKWAGEIADFAAEVQSFTGVELTAENLAEAIKTVNNKRRALARVFAATKAAGPIPISGKDRLLMTQIAFFDDPVRCAEKANALADELEQRVADGVSVFADGTKRLLVTGTPMAIPNWKLHHIIETSGAAVVCEEMCTGTRYFEHLVDEGATTLEDQYMALSQRYMKNNCACFTPNPGRIEDIVRLAREYNVDGVIDANLKFCTLYDIEKSAVAKALEAEGIPCLSLETDYTDNDAEQLRTRIQAFVEMLG